VNLVGTENENRILRLQVDWVTPGEITVSWENKPESREMEAWSTHRLSTLSKKHYARV
jgi:hypothetical protein